jgi:hypothetical protein
MHLLHLSDLIELVIPVVRMCTQVFRCAFTLDFAVAHFANLEWLRNRKTLTKNAAVDAVACRPSTSRR